MGSTGMPLSQATSHPFGVWGESPTHPLSSAVTTAAVRFVVAATVLHEPLLLALRRLAQEDASARRWGFETGEPGAHPGGGAG